MPRNAGHFLNRQDIFARYPALGTFKPVPKGRLLHADLLGKSGLSAGDRYSAFKGISAHVPYVLIFWLLSNQKICTRR